MKNFSVISSPPRAWGMRGPRVGRLAVQRFTPTPVGNACCLSALSRSQTVHPHACGECARGRSAEPRRAGSPPRLWGMRSLLGPLLFDPRFTPTPVGNAVMVLRELDRHLVHPHACGECRGLQGSVLVRAGSPPRLWGMPEDDAVGDVVVRFTPTPVGNAGRACPSRSSCAVHPHACGECSSAVCASGCHIGSPPRLWGMRLRRGRPVPRDRFTPTPVGNACGSCGPCSGMPVHPHACGECNGSSAG